MTIQNCGNTVTISHRPTRVMTISDDATNDVAAAGGLNLIVATAVTSSAPHPTTCLINSAGDAGSATLKQQEL